MLTQIAIIIIVTILTGFNNFLRNFSKGLKGPYHLRTYKRGLKRKIASKKTKTRFIMVNKRAKNPFNIDKKAS